MAATHTALEVVEAASSWHVIDGRGALLTTAGTQVEARAYVAGYRQGVADAAAVVQPSAERLAALGRA
jgi:hypothetical protein